MFLKRALLSYLAAFVALFLATGCGGGMDEPERPPLPPTPTATVAPDTAEPGRSIEDVVLSADSNLERGDYAEAISDYKELI